jgi:hypothetical protein
MVRLFLGTMNRDHGPDHKVTYHADYYVEEYCGRDGCPETCMGFDTTGTTFLEFTLEELRDRDKFNRAAKDAIRAYVMQRHPFKHEIKDEDIILCPTSF